MSVFLRFIAILTVCLDSTYGFTGLNRLIHRSRTIARASSTNTALVFVKPHAVNEPTCSMVRVKLEGAGCSIEKEIVISSKEIEEGGLIDAHYGTLAELAMDTDPRALNPSADLKQRFQEQFGVEWDDAPLQTNGAASAALGGLDGNELEAMWRRGPFLKLAPGCYVARLVKDEVPGLAQGSAPFTLNGFYPAMREQFLAEGSAVHAFVVSFDPERLTWSSFREDLVGATDPARASEESLRGTILASWEALELPSKPSMAANGVRASAGALEGLKERLIWVSKATPPFSSDALAGDPFGAALLEAGVSAATLSHWLAANPLVTPKNGGGAKASKIFDLTEGLDSSDILALVPSLADVA